MTQKFISTGKIYAVFCVSLFLILSNIVHAEQKLYYGDGAGFGVDQNTLVIDQRDNAGDLKLQFGNALDESISWDNSNLNFSISNNMSFGGNQLLDFRMENVSSTPTCDGTKNGRLYHNTTDDLSYVCDGFGWNRMDAVWSVNGNDAYFSIGKVGIGINPPISTTHVYENSTSVGTTAGLTIEQAGTGDAIMQYLTTGVQRWVTGIDHSDADKFKISTDADLNTNAALTIDTAGNVGIGTTDPSYELDIQNGQMRVSKSATSVASVYALSVQSNTTNTWLEILNNGGTNKGVFFGIQNNDFELWNYQAGEIKFFTDATASNGIVRMKITNDGKVSIGNDVTPQSTLDVDGGIMSREIAKATTASIDFDWDAGNQQEVTLNQVGHTFTFSNVTEGQILRIILCQDATGSRTVTTWPATMKWAEGVAPVLTTTASQCDVVSLIATNARGSVEVFGNVSRNF